MLIDSVTNAGALPVLETTMRFAAQRNRLITSNVANLSTPGYRLKDVSVEGFQASLRDAIDDRRTRFGADRGDLSLRSTRELAAGPNGSLSLRPTERGRNILFHDRNNRDLERTMQDLAENVAVFRAASELHRSLKGTLTAAIREAP